MMPKLLQDLSFPAIMAGFITCMIGISVSAVLVIEAAQSLGANQAQISSWLWALGIGIGVSGFLLPGNIAIRFQPPGRLPVWRWSLLLPVTIVWGKQLALF